MKPNLADNDFLELRSFVYAQCGIFFTERERYRLEHCLANRLAELEVDGFKRYIHKLKNEGIIRKELNHLFDAITINETYFFRTQAQINAFRRFLVPAIMQRNESVTAPALRVWSAGCSSGEEPYTLALTLLELMAVQQFNRRIEIIGSDISEQIIKRAREAIYGDYAMRNVPAHLKRKYFVEQDNGRFQLLPEVTGMVEFQQMNIVDPSRPMPRASMDVIFCRNVLIYFDDQAKQKVIEHFFQALKPEGYLIIGPSESLFAIEHPFKMIHHNEAVVYQKL